MFYLMSAAKLCLLVGMHLLLVGLRAAFRLLGRADRADRVFVLHSFLYVLSYVFSVNLCLQARKRAHAARPAPLTAPARTRAAPATGGCLALH